MKLLYRICNDFDVFVKWIN